MGVNMAAFPKLDKNPKDVKLEDLKSHTNIHHKTLNEISLFLKQLAIKDPNLFQLDQEQLQLFDTINRTTDNEFLKKVTQERLAAYPTVFPTVEDLEISNRNWQKQQITQNREQRIQEKVKIYDKPRRLDGSGQTKMFSYEKQEHVIVKYEGQLQETQFKPEMMEYVFQNKRIIAKIPSFFRFLNFGQEIGIPQDEIHNVLHMYTKTCLPEKLGMITLSNSMLSHNINLIMDSLDLEEEKKDIINKLKLIKRVPSTPLEEIRRDLFTLYNILFSLKNLHKNDTERTKLFIENPSCSSTEPKIKSLVEHHTTMGLKALTSVEAQRNINALISSQHELAPLSKESILEAIQKADLKYPLETTITLPPSAYYLSEDYSSINIPENPVIPAEFGELSSGSKDQYQRPHNNKDRNQFNRNRNNNRTFKDSRNYSRSHYRGEYPKDYKDKFAHNSQNRQHHPRNISRSHSRGRSTDFKHRSYSRDKNQRHQSRSPFSRYDSTKDTYTIRDNNRSRDRFKNGLYNRSRERFRNGSYNRSRERFRNESYNRYENSHGQRNKSQERNPSYSRERNCSKDRNYRERNPSQPRSHSNNRTPNYSTKERNPSYSRGGSSTRDRDYHRTPSPSPHPLAGYIRQNPREVANNKYYCF